MDSQGPETEAREDLPSSSTGKIERPAQRGRSSLGHAVFTHPFLHSSILTSSSVHIVSDFRQQGAWQNPRSREDIRVSVSNMALDQQERDRQKESLTKEDQSPEWKEEESRGPSSCQGFSRSVNRFKRQAEKAWLLRNIQSPLWWERCSKP